MYSIHFLNGDQSSTLIEMLGASMDETRDEAEILFKEFNDVGIFRVVSVKIYQDNQCIDLYDGHTWTSDWSIR